MKNAQSKAINIRLMTSEETRGCCEHLQIDYAFYTIPRLGRLLLASTPVGLCYLAFSDSDEPVLQEMRALFPKARIRAQKNEHQRIAVELLKKQHFEEEYQTLTLHLKGTDFQAQVWKSLLQIPHGQLKSYAEIAAEIGLPKACRAVGSAIGKNPVSCLIPCHRVVRADGKYGNYHWGTERKRRLIEQERQETEETTKTKIL